MINLRWRYGLIAGLFLAIFAAYPQIKMWNSQGADWNGHYAYNDIDEVAYASYLRALIDGRVRKNDPYTGRDDSDDLRQPESLFSIQFAAPYAVAIPARLFGISAPTAMTLAGVLAGFLAALCCFWLIALTTEDSVFAMAGALAVLCGGALAAGEGAIGEILGTGFSYPYFPFLRRYIPAVPFPAFFLFGISVWHLLKTDLVKAQVAWGIVGLCSFSFMVFSYFYLWTTAMAWFGCIVLIYTIDKIQCKSGGFWRLCSLGASLLIPLGVYAYLLSQRSGTMDNVQLLVMTHQVDLFRVPELIGYFVIAAICVGALFKKIDIRDQSVLFTLSFAIVPIVVFNQQLITGRSLQPIHYQVFIGNYVAALSVVCLIGNFLKSFNSKSSRLQTGLAVAIALSSIFWGFVECHFTVRVLDQANIVRDNGIPLARLLERSTAELDSLNQKTIFAVGNILADDLPTMTPMNVLWSRHQHVFAGLSWQESKERYYQYLYYQGLDEKWLKTRLRKGDFVPMIALFGWGRHTNRLSFQAKPLSFTEIDEEVARYRKYLKSFSLKTASSPRLSYLVYSANGKPDLTNVDKWYIRSDRQVAGIYQVYRLKLKDEKLTEKEKTASEDGLR